MSSPVSFLAMLGVPNFPNSFAPRFGARSLLPHHVSVATRAGSGVKMELGEYQAEPFEVGSFPAPYLYALQRLRSEEDKSFGAAFISLRAGE